MKKIILLVISISLCLYSTNVTAKVTTAVGKIAKTKAAKSCEQIITVTTKSLKFYIAKVNIYEKKDGKWKLVYKDLHGVVGRKGLMYNRKQETLTSPAGSYTITKAFGIAKDPGVKLPYRVVHEDDYWVCDPHSKYYNTWQKGPPNGRWDEDNQEHLIDLTDQYKYAAVIDFNTTRIPHVGAAIFLHVAPKDGKGTIGCIGMYEKDLLNVLKWIDPKKKTRIIICPESDIVNF